MVRPRLTVYVCRESLQLREQQQQPQQKYEDGDSNGAFFMRRAICLDELTAVELTGKTRSGSGQIYKPGPTGIRVLISDEMTRNFQEDACLWLQGKQKPVSTAVLPCSGTGRSVLRGRGLLQLLRTALLKGARVESRFEGL